MKLWTNSSIQTCHARSFRDDGPLVLVGLGEGFASGVGVISSAVGEAAGVGVRAGSADAVGKPATLGEGGAVSCGVGVTGSTVSVFFCDRNAQSATTRRTARMTAPITTGFHFTAVF